jgi:myo-inositol-1(or 4)-monophosphatase
MELNQAHDLAVAAARTAGELLRQGLAADKTIRHKSSAIDLLTEYDEAADKLISDRIREAFPHHKIITEESDQQGPISENSESSYTWYIDPLDGTNNFAHGYPVFSTSIALFREEQPLVGIVYDPNRDECFGAVNGQGAYLATKSQTHSIAVSQASELVNSLLATGFPYDRQRSDFDNIAQLRSLLKKAQGIRRSGSAALDLAYVAAGRLDGFWEFKLSSWDVAAGICLVQEAGGFVSDAQGHPCSLSPHKSIIASNGRIHQAMHSLLAAVPTPSY